MKFKFNLLMDPFLVGGFKLDEVVEGTVSVIA
jgi:hypothetical protein